MVIAHGNPATVFEVKGPSRLTFSRKGVDAYISPRDLEWTMIYTHEDDALGPFFTTAEWAQTGRLPAG